MRTLWDASVTLHTQKMHVYNHTHPSLPRVCSLLHILDCTFLFRKEVWRLFEWLIYIQLTGPHKTVAFYDLEIPLYASIVNGTFTRFLNIFRSAQFCSCAFSEFHSYLSATTLTFSFWRSIGNKAAGIPGRSKSPSFRELPCASIYVLLEWFRTPSHRDKAKPPGSSNNANCVTVMRSFNQLFWKENRQKPRWETLASVAFCLSSGQN